MGKSVEDYETRSTLFSRTRCLYGGRADSPGVARRKRLKHRNQNTETGEITRPQLEHKQPVTIPQPAAHPSRADQWRPDPEEEAIRAAELAESQRAAQPPAPRQRRERGGFGLE